MTDQTTSSVRPPRWRKLRIMAFCLACLATTIALLYVEEDMRGKLSWEKYKREGEARGERYDLAGLLPPPPPDDQNFWKAPIFAGFWNYQWDFQAEKSVPRDTNIVDRAQVNIWRDPPGDDLLKTGSMQRGRKADLRSVQQYYRARVDSPATADDPASVKAWEKRFGGKFGETNDFPVAPRPQTPATDVLLALSKCDAVVEELRQASKRPHAHYPIQYEKGMTTVAAELLPVLARFKAISQLLNLRATAELAAGQNEKALEDVTLLLRLIEALRAQPLLITQLVRMAMVQINLQSVWEGTADHQWSDAQLATLEQELGKLDFLADYGMAMRGERAFAISITEGWRRTRDYSYPEAPRTEADRGRSLNFLMPSGWLYQNEIAACRMHEQYTLRMIDLQRRVVSPSLVRQISNDFKSSHRHLTPYDLFTAMLFPAIEKSVERFTYTQSELDLARVACALERWRLAHGQYPETLEALAPQDIEELPHDIINGQSLKYRPDANGRYLLYSVGWNEKDDGGTVAFVKGGSPNRHEGDWVWPQAE